jgi:predicted RNA binding protein YcfA (HicA-like mRNA interferase family)/predicted RNase H-like HicB family nuclease
MAKTAFQALKKAGDHTFSEASK